MKKVVCLIAVICIMLAASPVNAQETPATAALIMDSETGQIVFAENIDAPLPPASITKLITMHLVFEALAQGRISLADQVTASANASSLPEGSAKIFLGQGEVLTVEELLESVAIISANDAGVALAEYIAGSEDAFVAMMNKKAQELGLTNTNFVNVHGLHHPQHTMSARDIALLARETLVRYPEILDYSARTYLRMERETRYVRQGYFDLHSTYASLIGWRNIDGLKTGWTPEAGRCIVATASQNGRRYIVVVMGADAITTRDARVKELLALAFGQFYPVVPVAAGEVVADVSVDGAKIQQVEAVAVSDLTLIMSQTENIEEFEAKTVLTPGLKAPLKQGDVVGTLSYYRDGEMVATVDLAASADVEKAGFFTRIFRFFGRVLSAFGKWVAGIVS